MRFDLIFSYWIYIWYLLYTYKILISYSPIFAITISILYNMIVLLLMIYYGTNMKSIIYFIITNTILKLIPYYNLRHDKIHTKDIYFTFILLILFIIWININNESLGKNQKTIYDSLIHGKNTTPFMKLLKKMFEEK